MAFNFPALLTRTGISFVEIMGIQRIRATMRHTSRLLAAVVQLRRRAICRRHLVQGTFCLVVLMAFALHASGQNPATFNKLSTVPSNHQIGNSDSGQTEPTQVIVVPRPVTGFSDCGLGAIPTGGAPQGASEARAQELDKHGPQLPPLFSMSSFAVMGFSRGGWPVAIDYLLEQDSLLLVIIAPEGEKPFIFRLDGKKGHWLTKLQIPSSTGDQLRVSQYLVQSLDDSVGQVSPSHVHIHGIAVGPKAVGSIGIDRVAFGPASIQPAQHQKAQYSYHSISDFDDTEVSFVRLAKSSSGEIVAAAVATKSMGRIAQDHVSNGDWDGNINKNEILKTFPPDLQQWLLAPNGQHVLQVRAWLRMKHGGDFVTAISDTIVAVK